MSEMSPESTQNVSQGSVQEAVLLSNPPEGQGKAQNNVQSHAQNNAQKPNERVKSEPNTKGLSPSGGATHPDRLQFLERLVATNDTLRKAYQQAFENQSGASRPELPKYDAPKSELAGKPMQETALSPEPAMDIERVVSEMSASADRAYEAKLDESHQQVVSLFDKLMPGMASLVEAKSKTEGQKAFLGHLEALFEQALLQKYPPTLWFSPETHQELVGRLVPVARQLAREMGLLTPEGAFKFAYSRQSAGVNQSAQAQGAAMQAGYVEPSSQSMPAKERAFDKAFREKDTLAMVRALFHRNS
jgi:hypothetical protein